MHFQMGPTGSYKWYYNWATGKWVGQDGDLLAPRIAAQISPNVVGKALNYFGLDANPLGPPAGLPEEEP